jgi:hypothetical protein
MAELKPLKGCHIVMQQRVMDFLCTTLEQVDKNYSDEMHEHKPKQVLDSLISLHGWTREKDDFGDKAFKVLDAAEGELRITVVLTKKGELKLDIRPWKVY